MMFRPSLILTTAVRAVFHTVVLFSIFLLFAGHNEPGGGFVGGLVAGAAFVLRYVSGGTEEVREVRPLRADVLLGLGLVIAAVVGAVPWLLGGDFLEHESLKADLPVLGTVKTTSALGFDIGVYLVVVGLVLAVLQSLGEDHGSDPRAEPGARR